jgi:hypothetical protein
MVNLQLLVFYTTEKTVTVTHKDVELFSFSNITTVKVLDGYYEVMQKVGESAIPVLRVPIANTNMLIQK